MNQNAPTMRFQATASAAHGLPHCGIEDGYRNLVAAILLQALRDLREPGYRNKAAQWLRTSAARNYAEQLGIEPEAVVKLAQRRSR